MTSTIRSGRPNPCKGCPDRKTACSGYCQKPDFLKWKEEQARIRAAKAAYKSPAWVSHEMDPARYRSGKKRK